MAWKYTGRIIRIGRSWTNNDGVTHPRNWASVWSDEDKTAAGLVWEDEPASFDSRFYWSADIPKALDDVNETWTQKEVDNGQAPEGTSAGDPKLDIEGNQIVTLGLKTQAIKQAKTTASGLLAPTDWYIVRNAETGEAIPTNVTTHRASVRSACDTIEALITNAADLDAFMALYDTPVDSDGYATGPAPINDFPEAF